MIVNQISFVCCLLISYISSTHSFFHPFFVGNEFQLRNTEESISGMEFLDKTEVNSTFSKRRVRYRGLYPREYNLKYKEIGGDVMTAEKVTMKGSTPAGQHIPIMVKECTEHLETVIECYNKNSTDRQLICVDCTLGYGGHSKEILKKLIASSGGSLYGMDQDANELSKTTSRLQSFISETNNMTTVKFLAENRNFRSLGEFLKSYNINGKVDFLIADLGVSSMQIDNTTRGFSHKRDGPLDMRMNLSSPLTAASYLSNISVEELSRVLSTNSDEPLAIPLARAILGLNYRSAFDSATSGSSSGGRKKASTSKSSLSSSKSIGIPTTTAELKKRVTAVCQHMGDVTGRGDVVTADFISSTAARVMQALRIEVNQEFASLDTLLSALPDALAPNGRAVFLTFHSGEDRRVKLAMKRDLQRGFYSDCSREVGRATEQERRANPRSACAKLR